jgi:hypothetical protein
MGACRHRYFLLGQLLVREQQEKLGYVASGSSLQFTLMHTSVYYTLLNWSSSSIISGMGCLCGRRVVIISFHIQWFLLQLIEWKVCAAADLRHNYCGLVRYTDAFLIVHAKWAVQTLCRNHVGCIVPRVELRSVTAAQLSGRGLNPYLYRPNLQPNAVKLTGSRGSYVQFRQLDWRVPGEVVTPHCPFD